jgi:hypothetical protein
MNRRPRFAVLLLVAVPACESRPVPGPTAAPAPAPIPAAAEQSAEPAIAPPRAVSTPTARPALSFEAMTGAVFLPTPVDRNRAPELRPIPVPPFPGAAAVWGATGRDHRGHVWFGVSAAGVPRPSARLFEYDPATDTLTDRGNVLDELRRAGRERPGEGQMKIHSKIVHGEDGHLYFASMDEQGEKADGSRLPTWGSHLWRLRLPDNTWEHLMAAPEALVAVAAGSRFVYALGYFGHVLYQFDTRTGAVRSVRVGAEGGHLSRNFLADARGHAFVPRLKRGPAGLVATLVELDTELKEVGETPLRHYTLTTDDDSHGIIGVQPLADRSLAFVTDRGCLYRVRAGPTGPAAVRELGLFHPKGEAYVASLFSPDGARYLVGLSRRRWHNDNRYEWLVYDLITRQAVASPVGLPKIDGRPPANPLLYGSTTRDDAGNFYLVGVDQRPTGDRPVVLQVRPPEPGK